MEPMLKPLVKGLKLSAFVKCPHCKALSKYGTPECKLCEAKLESSQDSPGEIVIENLGASYTPFIECPNCRKFSRVGTKRCPECYEEIDENYALSSATTIVVNTVACDVANYIRSYNPYAVIVVICGAFVYVSDVWLAGAPRMSYLMLPGPLVSLTTTLLWFYRFGKFQYGDEEFQAAKRHMHRSLTIWLAIIAAQIIALGIWWL